MNAGETGDAEYLQGRFQAAVAAYRESSLCDPAPSLAWSIAGCRAMERREYATAAGCLERALALKPNWFEAKHNLGNAYFELGRIDEALDLFAAAALGPRPEFPRESIAVVIPGSPRADHEAVLEARRSWAQTFLPPPFDPPVAARRPRSSDKLRIGYVSAFFAHDNWMKPLWALVNHHDRERFELHFFSDAPASAIRHAYRPHPDDVFHDITELSNDEAAARVADAGIDILVDLNSYSAPGRLPVVARRPAPVVVALLNLYATSGMTAYDYLIGDDQVISPDEERFYCERVLRVPGSYLTFSVDYPVPPIVAPPCASRGTITFGCLAPQYKITPAVLDAWCRILQRVPARMILRNRALGSRRTREAVRREFERRGIDPQRVDLRGPLEHGRFLATYDEIDIALDTFPYNGGTTTMEAIWQGVPVVTFRGDRWASRQGASLLRAGGLGRFVCDDQAAFEDLAVALASSGTIARELTELRFEMRSRLRTHSVCDTLGFARTIEGFYTEMAANAAARYGGDQVSARASAAAFPSS